MIIFVPLALVGFVIALMMPNLGWLAGYVFVAALASVWLGQRDLFLLFVSPFFAAGAVAGGLGRAAVLILDGWRLNRAAPQAPVSLAAIALCGWLYYVLA